MGVCFEEQGIDTSEMTGELLTAMFSAIAQKESESISGNMRWIYQARMKKGTFLPAASLAAPFFQFLSRKEDFFFDDGRMGSLRRSSSRCSTTSRQSVNGGCSGVWKLLN